MNRRGFIVGATALPLASRAMPALAPSTLTVDAQHAAPSRWTAGEPMMDRYVLTMERVQHGTGPAYTPDFLLEDIHGEPGRRFTEFSGDVSGRWIGAKATAALVYRQSSPELDEVVRRTIALQHPEGYFGKTFHFDHPDDRDLALLWGNGRLLIGLMEYYRLKKDPAVLASAKRLGDFLLRLGPSFNSKKMADEFDAAHFASSYICWTQQTEGLAALYAATNDTRYRDLCAAISERTQRRAADHVHGYLCSLRGTVDLYNATGEKGHLQRVEAAWQDVMQSGDVLVTGGVPEAWSPKKKRTEGCAECDWLRLNLSLWRASGNAKYLEMAEHTLFNEFAMNQFASGDFGHAMLTDAGVPSLVYVRAWWCCTLHGLRTFPDVHQNVFRSGVGEVFYDLPIDGRIESAALGAHATSQLTTDGTIRIQIEHAAAGQKLTLRKPSWAKELHVSVNGKAGAGLTVVEPKAGDIITAKYDMTLHQLPLATGKNHAVQNAFLYGPWLLGAPSVGNPGYFNELYADNRVLVETAKSVAGKTTSKFDVPIAATSVAFLPAEFPGQSAQVVLRAVAEQAASLPTQWQIMFTAQQK